LLSDKNFQEYASEKFVLVWENVRNPAKVTIDVGGGKKIETTLRGNTAMYLASGDGQVVDVFPGVYQWNDLRPELDKTLNFYHSRTQAANWNELHVRSVKSALSFDSSRASMSKAVVEIPLINKLALNAPDIAPIQANQIRLAAQNASKEPETNPKVLYAKLIQRVDDLSMNPGSPGNLELKQHLEKNPGLTEEQRRMLMERADSQASVRVYRPAIHLLMASLEKPPTVKSMSKQVFTEILKVPLDDPYLGLRNSAIMGK
jgi:hypothetical protein